VDIQAPITQGRNGNRIRRTILKELKKLKLQIITDKSSVSNQPCNTWNHGDKFSTYDFIIVSNHLTKFNNNFDTLWGIDKSDHAAIELTLVLDISKGPGLFRPDSSFLDKPELALEFRNELKDLLDQAPCEWNPHDKLEFTKVSIRTLLGVHSKRYLNNLNSTLNNVRTELNNLINRKQLILVNPYKHSVAGIDLTNLNYDIDNLQNKFSNALSERSKYLSKRARVKWLEFGEKSNKYFLNLIHRNSFNTFLNELYDPTQGKFTKDNDSKLVIAHKFYSDLYSFEDTLDPTEFLSSINVPNTDNDKWKVVGENINIVELTNALKKCGNTASGPDGIGYNVLKHTWDIYSYILLDSWNYGQKIGLLSNSHRESVICLLEKKGKDRRYINNLRPISLSNCDIKVITKALTHKFKSILPTIIHPMQAAYVAGRQVHDNIRLINLVKDYCSNDDKSPILISLDAKKAFDSVSHSFISDVLKKYNAPSYFLDIFKLLYRNIQSKVMVNGFPSKSFNIERSVKQGDALSCVLFDLCIDILLRSIYSNNAIPSIRIMSLHIPKAIAYADDVAVLTYSSGIQDLFRTYETFSKMSGLFLNADKTEFLNLNAKSDIKEVNFHYDNSSQCIKTVPSIKICGITFSLDNTLEFDSNVKSKIQNLSNALSSWNKRNLSIFGRNLILKTFGLSQLIYSMQNTSFPQDSLDEINKICFQFLWNKKSNKSRAYERVARKTLIKPLSQGGLNAPDIFSINKSLKVKQFLRSISQYNNHFIAEFQSVICNKVNIVSSIHTKSPFINDALAAINELGDMVIKEIIYVGDQKISKNYYDLIASSNLADLIMCSSNNQIALSYAITLKKNLGICNVKQFLNEFKFPSSDCNAKLSAFIINSEFKLFSKLLERKQLNDDCSLFDSIPVVTNRFLSVDQITTKALTKCFTNLTCNLSPSDDENIEPTIAYGMHPKENEVHFLVLHNACLSNLKLFNTKLVDSNLCEQCKVAQDIEHIFHKCLNAILLWETILTNFGYKFTDSEFIYGVKDKKMNEILLVAKRLLFLNKDKTLDKKFINKIISDRISDINTIAAHKNTKKARLAARKIILN
jgi:hypothetical protein